MKLKIVILGVSAVVALTGCGNSKEASKGNFKAAVQAHLDKKQGVCTVIAEKDFPFSVEKEGFLRDRYAQASALAEAGLLTKTDITMTVTGLGGNQQIPGAEFNLTEEGKKFRLTEAGVLGPTNSFCTGKFKVSEVKNYTEPSDQMGVKMSRVNYVSSVEDVADWAKLPGVQKAFPRLASEIKPQVEGQAVLILTSEGWIHEKDFRKGG